MLIHPEPFQLSGQTARQQDKDRGRKRRRLLSNLVILFVICLPIEGICRKWLFNSYEKAFFFLRDPIMIAIIFIYIGSLDFRKARWFLAWLLMMTVLLFSSLVQSLVFDLPLPIVFIGLRNYCLFLPLLFIIGDIFGLNELRRFICVCLYMAIPISVLVALQYFSSVDSEINRGISDDIETRFLLIEGIVRPYGPFTFNTAQASFAAFLTAILIIGWINRIRLNISKNLLAVASASVFVMVILGGSRTLLLTSLFIVASYAGSILVLKDSKKRVNYVIIMIIGACVLGSATLFIFPSAVNAIFERQEQASAIEGSIEYRMFDVVAEWVSFVPFAPLLGYGLGSGTFAGSYLSKGVAEITLAEYDASRVIMEVGPVIGVIIILGRLGLLVFLARKSIQIMTKNPSAFIMLGYVASVFLAQQMTGVNQIVSLAWLSAGINLAVVRQLREI